MRRASLKGRFVFAVGIAAVNLMQANAQLTPEVQVVQPVRADVERRVSFPATLAPWQQTILKPRISGQVQEVFVDIGDKVTTGQVLARLDTPELLAELSAAQADIAQSSATLAQAVAEGIMAKAELQSSQISLDLGSRQTERLRGLQRSQSATAKEIEEAQKYMISAQAGAESAKAKVAMASAQMQVADAMRQTAMAKLEKAQMLLDFQEVRAPFAGVIVNRMIDIGAMVNAADTSLFEIVDNSRLRARVDLSGADAAYGTVGQPAKISSDALRDWSYSGEIRRTAASLSHNTKTLRVEIDIKNQDGKLLSGMFMNADIQLDVHKNALSLPANTIATKGGKSTVLTVEDGKIKQVVVKTGYDDAIHTEVIDGLTGNEYIVSSSRDGLADGVSVTFDATKVQRIAEKSGDH